MSLGEIKERLTGILSSVFADETIDSNTIQHADLIDEFGMDSLTFVSAIIQIETEFEIIIPDDKLQIENFRNVDSVTQVVNDILNDNTNKDLIQ